MPRFRGPAKKSWNEKTNLYKYEVGEEALKRMLKSSGPADVEAAQLILEHLRYGLYSTKSRGNGNLIYQSFIRMFARLSGMPLKDASNTDSGTGSLIYRWRAHLEKHVRRSDYTGLLTPLSEDARKALDVLQAGYKAEKSVNHLNQQQVVSLRPLRDVFSRIMGFESSQEFSDYLKEQYFLSESNAFSHTTLGPFIWIAYRDFGLSGRRAASYLLPYFVLNLDYSFTDGSKTQVNVDLQNTKLIEFLLETVKDGENSIEDVEAFLAKKERLYKISRLLSLNKISVMLSIRAGFAESMDLVSDAGVYARKFADVGVEHVSGATLAQALTDFLLVDIKGNALPEDQQDGIVRSPESARSFEEIPLATLLSNAQLNKLARRGVDDSTSPQDAIAALRTSKIKVELFTSDFDQFNDDDEKEDDDDDDDLLRPDGRLDASVSTDASVESSADEEVGQRDEPVSSVDRSNGTVADNLELNPIPSPVREDDEDDRALRKRSHEEASTPDSPQAYVYKRLRRGSRPRLE
ncbi:uncharacterized protein JCM6883_004928 [Sporobolomyces salmoneus]|uniref:uncharacterized protein n=1 Tax=Sporobolomyces salmoneus TaxID=183962 RepID=UPI00317FBB3D